MTDLFGLTGTPAMVIGGASGIGRATAQMLADVGAKVCVADLDPVAAGNVADEIGASGGTGSQDDTISQAGVAALK